MLNDARKRAVWHTFVAILFCASLSNVGFAQNPDTVHYRHRADMPPGVIGQEQLRRGGPLPGYYQPVEMRGPDGARVSVVSGDGFDPDQPMPAIVGLLIGQVYRFKISSIPVHEGQEVYPTVEVIDRLYPPVGQKVRFPIPIELTQEELHLALAGKFVTRVIYLEDPEAAFPHHEIQGQQRYFEVLPGDDPLLLADVLGRPVAILRMGGRVPDANGSDVAFLFGSPPLVNYSRMMEGREQIDRPTGQVKTAAASSAGGNIHGITPASASMGTAPTPTGPVPPRRHANLTGQLFRTGE